MATAKSTQIGTVAVEPIKFASVQQVLQVEHERFPLSHLQLNQLLANLNPSRVSNRKQGGATLSYLEAWDVKASLIRVFGFGGFSAEVINPTLQRMDHDIPSYEYNTDRKAPKVQKVDPETGELIFNWRITAMCTVKLTIHQTGAVYSEAAVASQTGPDVGEVADFAIKTAESDALKRAAIYLGTTFGLSLYNKGDSMDVVKTSLAPGQTNMDRARLATEYNAAREIAQDIAKTAQAAGVDPGTGEADDSQQAPSPEATAAATSALAQGFGSKP